MTARVLVKMGETVRAHGMMYNTVAQSVLMYVSESWVVIGGMLKFLEGYHQQVARQIMGMTTTSEADGEW